MKMVDDDVLSCSCSAVISFRLITRNVHLLLRRPLHYTRPWSVQAELLLCTAAASAKVTEVVRMDANLM